MYVYNYARGSGNLSRKGKKSIGLLPKFAKMLDFPCDTFGGIHTLELKGNFEATVYGCSKVMDYSDNTVILAVNNQNIVIEGSHLVLCDFTAGAISVVGTIDSVRFKWND